MIAGCIKVSRGLKKEEKGERISQPGENLLGNAMAHNFAA